MTMQQVFYDFSIFNILKGKKPLLVCDKIFDTFGIKFPCKVMRFDGFSSNPVYEDICTGVEILKKNNCDFIVAVGGGSTIDTAKAIKYYSGADYPLMAVPTTSGTGSEATHFALVYRNGEKHSVSDQCLLPKYVILQSNLLKTLPLYQKKCTMLDALCQAIESWWSKRATEESIRYSKEAIDLIMKYMDSYLKNEDSGNAKMLLASHLAGKAINITTTTAPHAMSYKLTSLYGIPHGHAVAICLPKVWKQMSNFDDIAIALGQQNHEAAISFFEELLQRLNILPPDNVNKEDLDILTNSVNIERLSNNPVQFDKKTIKELYREILEV